MSERPDPNELEPLTKDEATYQRNADGELIAQPHAVDTSEGWKRVDIKPVPKGEAMELERRFGDRDDVDIEELDALMNEKIEGDVDWSDPDVKPGVYAPVLDQLMEVITGEVPDNEFHAEVREELESRNEDSGN